MMQDKQFLMIPGPTPVPESVLLAMAKHPIGHRSKEFSAILKEVYSDLKWLFRTKNEVFIYTSSGTGAMEGALSNLINKGDKVLSLVMGNFGERWAKIAKSKGADVRKLEVPAGQAISPSSLKEVLDNNTDIKIVTLTHNETATGVTNPLKELVQIINEHGALSVVDGVTSVGAMPVEMDEWGIDVLVSGSQKGFMIPPGLAFLVCSDKAFAVYEKCEHPSFYFNFDAYRKSALKNSTPYTPNVSLIIALAEALKMMKAEGLENIHARHAKLATGLRKALRAMRLKLFVEDDTIASNAITSILAPDNVSIPDIRATINKDFDIVVANGQGALKDKIFRMGHLGYVSERDLIASVGTLEITLAKLGHDFSVGDGVKSLINEFAEVPLKK